MKGEFLGATDRQRYERKDASPWSILLYKMKWITKPVFNNGGILVQSITLGVATKCRNANHRTAEFMYKNINITVTRHFKISASQLFCIVRSSSRCFDLQRQEACDVNEYKYSPRNPSVGDYLLRAAVDEGRGGYFGGTSEHPLLSDVATSDGGLRLDHLVSKTEAKK